MPDGLKLPAKPSGLNWDIAVTRNIVSVKLRNGWSEEVVADGGNARIGANESEAFVASTVVSLAQTALRDYERARALSSQFGITVSAY